MLNVWYKGYGRNVQLGVLTACKTGLTWAWHPDAVAQALNLSPFRVPLGLTPQSDFPPHLYSLPGFVYDSLPDGWGLLLQDKNLAANQQALTALKRLLAVGDTAFGALSFEPAAPIAVPQNTSIEQWADYCQQFQAEPTTVLLDRLRQVGGSAQGARPKVAITFDAKTQRTAPDGDPWLFKFPHATEHTEVTAIEAAYADLAKAGGIDMPEHTWLAWPTGSAFGVKRFDRIGEMRIPVQSAAALLHADYRLPSSISYPTLMKLTMLLTRQDADVQALYHRIVFNVVFHNQDSHGKNFSFIWQKDGGYRLAPAFDLTYSVGPGHEHHANFYGSGRPTWADLLKLATDSNIPEATARASLEQWLTLAQQLPERLTAYSVRKQTIKDLRTVLADVYTSLKYDGVSPGFAVK